MQRCRRQCVVDGAAAPIGSLVGYVRRRRGSGGCYRGDDVAVAVAVARRCCGLQREDGQEEGV